MTRATLMTTASVLAVLGTNTAFGASIVVDAGAGADMVLSGPGGTYDSESVGPSGSANIYASNDGGATLLNGGNTNASLSWAQTITDGLVVTLITNSFGDSDSVYGFDILGTDGVTVVYDGAVDAGNVNTGAATIADGATLNVVDSDGVTTWDVTYNFVGATGGDFIGAVDSVADGTADIASTLTFAQGADVPEPGSLALLGLGGLALLRRRRA